ncbi:2OG-Fe(II) oxygenase [Peredibacter starrii]|uniref:2OG-Fe(II) oxygenase n=1 Tax=Peredibacter starrii TaxID=28202 RepID=A0AAX4HJ63_9BACT|nr:2OG-Fe(II) oxygenase [Peredibacter starrii]WPU63271.1 2OG-Fe(II) oxygenase [Peredibacter starrii]
MLKRPELFQNGFHKTYFPLGDDIRELVRNEDWKNLDGAFQELTKENGRLFNFLRTFHDFISIEFIISIRDAANEWEEDGIWHDDGSRVFAFSLSLSEDSDQIEGGRLGVRQKNTEEFLQIPTPEFGGIILFLTGLYGYEHKIHQVTKGRRIIIAGWCS